MFAIPTNILWPTVPDLFPVNDISLTSVLLLTFKLSTVRSSNNPLSTVISLNVAESGRVFPFSPVLPPSPPTKFISPFEPTFKLPMKNSPVSFIPV